MNSEFFDALDLLEKEKHIPKQYMLEKVEAALTAACKKEYGAANISVVIDAEKKDIKVYRNDEGKYVNTMTEIGNGNIWWDGVMETAKRIGVKSYVVEQDKDFIDDDAFKAIAASAEYLKKYID
jgi:hypothetical protein